jgi:hypothetical protein
MLPVLVNLNDEEIKICRWLAKKRENTNEINKVEEKKLSDDGALDIHIRGTEGEFVVAKYLNTYPDFTTNSRKGGNELIYCGWRVDAKNTTPHNNLMVQNYKKAGEIDIYIIVNGKNPYNIVGWCYENEIMKEENLIDFARIPSYFLKGKDLRYPKELKNIEYKPENKSLEKITSVFINLNNEEIKVCEAIAKKRRGNDRKNNIIDRKLSDDEGIEIDIRGMIGEFVIAKYLNIYPDFTTQPRGGGYELTYRNWSIDAKNRTPYKDMMTPTYKKKGESDIYIVVSGKNPYEIIGWCLEDELIKDENIINFARTPSYFLERKNLHRPEKLKNLKSKETS